jgi:hypothetical protein
MKNKVTKARLIIGIVPLIILASFVGYKRWVNNDPVAIKINPYRTPAIYKLDEVIGVIMQSSVTGHLELKNGNESSSFRDYHLINRKGEEISLESDLDSIIKHLD